MLLSAVLTVSLFGQLSEVLQVRICNVTTGKHP